MNISCPPSTIWIGPDGSGEPNVTVNGQTEGHCARADGTRHGPAITWHANGLRAAAGEYSDDLKEGEWQFWHETGQRSGNGVFLRGLPDGEWKTWHSNGQLESIGKYENGVQEGLFAYWTDESKKLKESRFHNGNLVETILESSKNPSPTP